jgi:glycosyltransferase involved in cell wall biosynthesis
MGDGWRSRVAALVKNTPKVLNLKDSMKVLFLASWYPMNGRSGNGIFAIRQAEALAQAYRRSGRSVTVDVMAVQPRAWTGGRVQILGEVPDVLDRTTQAGGLRHWLLDYRDGRGGMFSLIDQCWAWIRLLRAYRRHHGERPTVVVAQVAWKAAIAALLLGRPYGVMEHWSGYLEKEPPLKPIPKWLVRLSLRNARSVAAVSPWLADALMQFCSGLRVSTLPNVIEEVHWTPPAVDLAAGQGAAGDVTSGSEPWRDPRVFLHVSDLAPVKNPALLFGAWALSGLSDQGYLLRVAGEYSQESKARYASVKGLEWLGILSPTELCYQLRSSRALLLSSHRETFSILAGEALLNGCSVWTSYPPLRSFYQGLDGLVSLPDDQPLTWSLALQEAAASNPHPWNSPQAVRLVQERLKPYRNHEAGQAMLSWIDAWKP